MKQVYESGTKHIYNDERQLHSTTEAAVVYPNGSEYWYRNGLPHRDNDLPAITLNIPAPGGPVFYWYVDGVQHRDCGPAVVGANGNVAWRWHGKRLSFNEYCKEANTGAAVKLMLVLKYNITDADYIPNKQDI